MTAFGGERQDMAAETNIVPEHELSVSACNRSGWVGDISTKAAFTLRFGQLMGSTK
jgi:hypothetical protein